MMRTLVRRLNKLEEQLKPGAEPRQWQVVIVNSDGKQVGLGPLIEWSPAGSRRIGAKSE